MKPTIYVAMSYRGNDGDIETNVMIATRTHRILCELFPQVEWVLPHTHPRLATYNEQVASGAITEDDVFPNCFKLVRECDGFLMVGDISEGVDLEQVVASWADMPIMHMLDIDSEEEREDLARFLYTHNIV